MNKKLAIVGHLTRGNEVIELLEMMGGKNSNGFICSSPNRFYYILNEYFCLDYIDSEEINEYVIFTLEEFLEKYPFKVGDKIPNVLFWGDSFTVKSMNWDENYKTIMYGFEELGFVVRADELSDYDNYPNKSSKDMEDKAKAPDLKGEDFSNKRFGYKIPNGYKFDVVVDGKIILKPIKPKYPKTYKECCDVLLIPPYYNLRYHTYERGYNEYATSNSLLSLQDKLNTLGKLLICLDAYWKIAGEEMGLDGPWEPDWDNLSTNHEFIKISKGCFTYSSRLLVFPTVEMRDVFYENFKDLIESCKELL